MRGVGWAGARARAVMAAVLLGQAGLLAAQDPDAAGAGPARGSEIVVTGTDLREGEVLPIEARQPQRLAKATRQIVSDAARFARCAGMPRPSLLGRIVDGRPETGETMNALHLHVLRNSGCSGDIPALPPSHATPWYGDCNPVLTPDGKEICRADYDRGAIYELVLEEHAGGMGLTRAQTFDKAVRARFLAREEARNAARNRSGKLFWLAACLVQVRPEYGTRLLHEQPGGGREARLIALMVSDGRMCMGLDEVGDLRLDNGQMRAFIAEAVYSWHLAATGRRSLPVSQEQD